MNDLKEKNASIPLGSENGRPCRRCGNREITYDQWLNRNGMCDFCREDIKIEREKSLIQDRIAYKIPLKYQQIESDHPELLKIDKPESLFITGNTGAGKTVLACSIAKKSIRNLQDITYISYPAFIMELQSAFKKDHENPFDMAEKVAKDEKILFIDDLGAEKITDFVRQITYFILNEREQKCLITVITSNFSLSQLDEQVDPRISSRIAGMCRVIKLTGEDRRI